MMRKKQLLFSIVLSSLLLACSGESGSSTSVTSNENSKSNSNDSTMVLDTNARIDKTPEEYLYEINKDKFKNLSSIQLGITPDGYSGKVLANYLDFRKVDIPDTYKTRTQTISGSILGDVKNARICLDVNENNLCDNNEPLAITKEDSTFELKVTSEEKAKDKNIIAVRGLNILANRSEVSILKAENKDGVVLSPFSTLLALAPGIKNSLENIYGNDLESKELYKESLVLQKAVDILASSYNKKEDKEIIAKSLEVYGEIANNLNTSLENTIENLTGTEISKAKEAVKDMVNQVNAINLSTPKHKEALAVILNSRLNDARTHFRTSDGDLSLAQIEGSSLVKDAISIRLKEIFMTNEDISEDILTAAESLDSIKDLEDIEKVKAKNEPALEPLVIQLNKRNNATSELLILKALLIGNKLEIYFAENSEIGLSDESKADLENIEKVKKIYTIEGLNYEIQSSSWDDEGSKNTITFVDIPTHKAGEKRIYINYLALKDTKDKYTKEKPVYSVLELPRKIPTTGQRKVWFEKDDGSLRYGEVLNFVVDESSDRVLKNEYTNLMWQDAPYTDTGDTPNDVITYEQAQNYCENLSYAGHNDWRMPNVKELVSTTSINMQADGIFQNYSKSEISFSDSSQSTVLGDRVIGVDKNGRVTNLIGNSLDTGFGRYSVRCVRNLDSTRPSLFPDAAFDNIVVLEEDKTSYDPSTNLVYLDKPFTDEEIAARKEASTKGFDEIENIGRFGDLKYAIEYCTKLNEEDNGNGFAGFKNWRVANANEVFYSLNSKGSRTFQHRLEGFDYTLTSSSSLKDNARYPWIVGNFFNRKPVHNRTKGFFRCVTNKNDKVLDQALPVDTREKANVKRKYKLGDKKEINLTLPANIFNRYEGISITALEPLDYLDDRQYEISNIIPKNESFPGFTIKSVKVKEDNGQLSEDICKPLTSWIGLSQSPGTQCETDGLFRIYLQKDLTLNTYGKSILEEGKTYAITIQKRYDLGDFTINLTIGQNDQIQDPNGGSQTNPNSEGFSIAVNQPQQTDIEIAVSSGYRMEDGSPDILSSIDSNDLFKVITLKKDDKEFTCTGKTGSEYDKCYRKKVETIDSLTNFKIVSGDKNIFEVWDGYHNYLYVKSENKLALKVGQEYELGIDVVGNDDKKIGETINIKVIVEKTILEAKKEVIEKDVSDSNNYRLKTSGEPVLFTFESGSFATQNHLGEPINEHKINPFTNTNASIWDIIFELENPDDDYRIERVEFYGSKYYAVILNKDKKAPESKTLKVVAKIPYKDTSSSNIKYIESKFDLRITNNDDLSYQALQLKAKNKTEIVGQRPDPTDDIVEEKLDIVLQNYTGTIINGKIYPSSTYFSIAKNSDFMTTSSSLTGVDIKVIDVEFKEDGTQAYIKEGAEYFEDKLEAYLGGHVLYFNKSNLPKAGEYKVKIQAVKQDNENLRSNEATLSFRIYPITAPGVIDSIDVDLADKAGIWEKVSLTDSGEKNITPLFLFQQKQNESGTIELIKRFKLNENSINLNSEFNGVSVSDGDIIHTLVSSTDDKYYIRKVYRGYSSPLEGVYALFLKAGKTAQAGDVLEVKVTGTFDGVEYPNENAVTINITGEAYTNSSTVDYDEDGGSGGTNDENPYDPSADANFVLKQEYTKTTDDPIRLNWKKIYISESKIVESKTSGKEYDLEILNHTDKFTVGNYSSFLEEWSIEFTDQTTTGVYALQLRAKYKDSNTWSNTITVHFTIQ